MLRTPWGLVVGVVVGAFGCVVPPEAGPSDAGSALPDGGADERAAVTVDAVDASTTPDDVPAADVPAADVPAADVPAADVPAADVPAADVPAADVPADVPYGALGASCRAWVPACLTGYPGYECEAGLVCVDGRCAAGLATGARCGAGVPGLCAENSSCIEDDAAVTRCAVRGTLGADCVSNIRYWCDEGGTAPYVCFDGLICSPSTLRCFRPTAPGAPCTGDTCGPQGACVGAPGASVCVTRGARDAPCRVGSSGRCDAGLACVNVGGQHPERCLPALAIGARCDPAGSLGRCEGGACGPGADGPRCIASGNPGAPCLGGGFCLAGAVCAIDRCVREAAPGAACEPRFGSVLCTTSSVCVAHDRELSRGTCTTAGPEREPNAEATPELLVGSAAVRGTLTGATDSEDCFQVMVPAGGTLVAETSSLVGVGCVFGTTTITVANAASAFRRESSPTSESRSTCARVLGAGLSAGAYTVCVRAPSPFELEYALSLSVLPAAP